MQLEFNINEQTITHVNPEKNVVANSVNYLTCKFTFSEDWCGITKTAVFVSAKGIVKNIILEDDTCEVPWEVIEHPHFTVSVFGGDRITANKVSVSVTKSGYLEGETQKEPTPDVYTQILNSVKPPYIGENGNWFVWDSESKSFVDSGFRSQGEIPEEEIKQYINAQTSEMKQDIDGIQKQINEESHFRGYLSTDAKIKALEATPNDFAYSAESGTKWVYDAENGWQDTKTPVPDQLTPASDATPLVNGTPTAGTANEYARGDHRHPTDTTRASATELNLVKQTLGDCSNAVKKTLKYLSSRVVIDDISPLEHIVKVRVLSPFTTIENTTVSVTDVNGVVTEYIPNIDGIVDVISVAPTMTLYVESTRAMDSPNFAEIEYNQDINKMSNSTEENLTELVETIKADGTLSIYERSKDTSGNPYNFKSMYVGIVVKPTVSNRIEVDFYDSEDLIMRKRLCSYPFTNTVGKNGFISIHADVIGGMWQAIATSAESQGAPTAVRMWGENLVPYNGEKIRFISIKGATTAIASDATIKIYGVR